ncbi:triphosphoribosyl-dephospho-CoA synthase [Streptomyces sp. NPDC002812]|uniref:triphosphoribosyl-dephospho-CoA synthase n=1 Tax=Streptomyces sp. NPDC002812 TaxID=3154434 RepID=UPI0033258A58
MTHSDDWLADAAVDALTGAVMLGPGPGLPDDPAAARWMAGTLRPPLAAMAAAARRNGAATQLLREELAAIGRGAEWSSARDGTRSPRGAIWTLGLLVAAAAVSPGRSGKPLIVAGQLGALHDGGTPRRPSPGSEASVRYGAAGARGEARAGFPHVRRAAQALRAAREAGLNEPSVRLSALLTVMCTLQDTGVLYAAGPQGRIFVQQGAREVLDSGLDADALGAFEAELRRRGLAPRGSVPTLAGALFLEAVAAPTECGGFGKVNSQPRHSRVAARC